MKVHKMMRASFKTSLFVAVIFAVSFILLSESPARADFYRYTDEDGVVHITNVPTSSSYRWFMREKNHGTIVTKTKPGRIPTVDVSGKYEDIIRRTSERYGVDPALVKAIVKAESDFDYMAISVKGARGLMQLMPETARLMGVRQIHDPEENVEGGIRYLSHLLSLFDSNLNLAIAAYNAGENAVLKYGAIPPFSETKTYVQRVLKYYNAYTNGAMK